MEGLRRNPRSTPRHRSSTPHRTKKKKLLDRSELAKRGWGSLTVVEVFISHFEWDTVGVPTGHGIQRKRQEHASSIPLEEGAVLVWRRGAASHKKPPVSSDIRPHRPEIASEPEKRGGSGSMGTLQYAVGTACVVVINCLEVDQRAYKVREGFILCASLFVWLREIRAWLFTMVSVAKAHAALSWRECEVQTRHVVLGVRYRGDRWPWHVMQEITVFPTLGRKRATKSNWKQALES
ncbi:hypothetical protein EDB89DRAFT_1904117 [Lactarius sanguifluus]|nr:hypothetical protein EDB89DRAFT_1904117 [Lactarius sanguifluus]